MSRELEAPEPRGILYRIGWVPDPLAYPPWEYVGGERYDDPNREYRVLYAGAPRRVAFLETLAQFRPDPALLAAERDTGLSDEDDSVLADPVPNLWLDRHLVGALRLTPGQRWLDLRKLRTRQALRSVFAAELVSLGLEDLDASTVTGPYRELTQAISRWAYDRGYQGIAFPSRHEPRYSNWAIFEGAAFEPVGEPRRISRRDRSLTYVLRQFGLSLEPQGSADEG